MDSSDRNVVPSGFSFFGLKPKLDVGVYDCTIDSFRFIEKVSKAGNGYKLPMILVNVQGKTYPVNLSLDPTDKAKSLYRLIVQLSKSEGLSVEDITEMCQVPQDFFNYILGKTIKVESNAKGYIDILDTEMADIVNSQQDEPEF